MSKNGSNAPKLGDVEIVRDGERWAVHKGGKLVVTGLDFRQMLEVVNGRFTPWVEGASNGKSNGS